MGLKRKIVDDDPWLCSLCDENSFLTTQLFNENRVIKIVEGDGNCMYSSLALIKYKNKKMHKTIRASICKKMKEVFLSSKYTDKWVAHEIDSDLNIRNPEVKLIRDISRYNREVFGVNSNELEISLQKRVEYLNMKSTPAKLSDTSNIRLKRYGTEIDLMFFSLIENKPIWILQPDRKFKSLKYKWWLAINYSSKLSHENAVKQLDYITLFYKNPTGNTNCAHYDAIISKNKRNPPLDESKIYKKFMT